jgi:UDP:flavonoid glycosyltransferase YjiC (YdhE family)
MPSQEADAPPGRARRVLFFAEAVTLAHVARPLVLMDALPPDAWHAVLACDDRYHRFTHNLQRETLPLGSIDSARFLRALAQGKPVYSIETLRGYVAEDLRLIDRVRPDIIVGDFRLSLSVSARVARVPYVAIANWYWSPLRPRRQFPLPVLPMTRWLPLPVAHALFRWASPIAFAAHCAPLNRLRREHGLASLGNDLRRVYTDADQTLYADAPAERPELPTYHRVIGPIVWSPPVALPPWWGTLPSDRPLVYVTLGSSGMHRVLGALVQALAQLPVVVVVATAGAALEAPLPANVFTADYLPGAEAAARAALVVCNGGSPTCQQAAAAGVPVLGIASNMDQFINMEAVEEAGAGIVMRADRLTRVQLQHAITQMLTSSEYRAAAARLANHHLRFDAKREFVTALRSIS